MDGYNVINKYPRLKKRLLRGELWKAREMLNEQLEELAGLRGWRVTVVYDGAQNKNKGAAEEAHTGGAKVKAEGSTAGLDVLFSPLGVEADTVIERLAFEEGRAEGGAARGKFIVCSDDGQIKIAAVSNGGESGVIDRAQMFGERRNFSLTNTFARHSRSAVCLGNNRRTKGRKEGHHGRRGGGQRQGRGAGGGLQEGLEGGRQHRPRGHQGGAEKKGGEAAETGGGEGGGEGRLSCVCCC